MLQRRCISATVDHVENGSRESLAIEVGRSLKGKDILNTLDRITAERGPPATIKVDNGSELISKLMGKCVYERGVNRNFSCSGTSTDDAEVES